jgi:hypothetical protein
MLRLLDRSVRRPRDVDVERFDTPPVADLRSAYESGVPRRLHLARDEEYLQWRFANPRWRTTTYVGYREGTPEASVVAAVPRRDGLDLVYLLDVQPMATTDASDRSLRAVLGSVVADHEAADLLKAPGGLHQRLFRRFSFLSESFPIDRATNSQRLVVRPLDAIPGSTLAVTDETWQLDGQDLTDPDEWRLTPGDVDFE